MKYQLKNRAVEAIQFNTVADAIEIFERCPLVQRMYLCKTTDKQDTCPIELYDERGEYYEVNKHSYIIWNEEISILSEEDFTQLYEAIT